MLLFYLRSTNGSVAPGPYEWDYEDGTSPFDNDAPAPVHFEEKEKLNEGPTADMLWGFKSGVLLAERTARSRKDEEALLALMLEDDEEFDA